MFGENLLKKIPSFGKKASPEAPEAVVSEPEIVVSELELLQRFDSIKDQGLKDSINDHAMAVISGEAQDSVQRSKLEEWAQREGVDTTTLGQLISLQAKRLNEGQ